MDKQTEASYDSQVGSQIKVSHDIGEVRIKLDAEGYSYFKDAKRVEIDGRLMFKVTDVKKHGLFKGSWLAVKRITNCHPWGKSGYDPVP